MLERKILKHTKILMRQRYFTHDISIVADSKLYNKGPFIFYEIGGAGGIEGGAMKKKTGLKGGAIQKNIVCKGGSLKKLP